MFTIATAIAVGVVAPSAEIVAEPIAEGPAHVLLATPEGASSMGRARAALDTTRGRYLVAAVKNTGAPYSFDTMLVDADGGEVAGTRRSIGVGSYDYNPAGQPSVAYNATTDEYLAVWSHGSGGFWDAGAHSGVLSGVRIAAATGAIAAGPFVIIDPPGAYFCEVRAAEVVYNPADGGYLVSHNYAWFTTSGGGADCVGASPGGNHQLRVTRVSGAGVAGSSVTIPGTVGNWYRTSSIARNPRTGEFLVVSNATGTAPAERIVAHRLTSAGALTGVLIEVDNNTAGTGRVAADPVSGDWLVAAYTSDDGRVTRAHRYAADGTPLGSQTIQSAASPLHLISVGDGTYVMRDAAASGQLFHLGPTGAQIGARLTAVGGDQVIGTGQPGAPLLVFGRFNETAGNIGVREVVLGPGEPVLGTGQVGPGERICFTVAGTPGDVALVNLTPVEATAPGYGLLVSSDVADPPTASNVNFAPGTVDPNVAAAAIGTDGSVCYVNGPTAGAHLVADHLLTIRAAAITLATPAGSSVRVADTRVGVGGTRLAPSARVCFDVAGNPGDVALVNLTPVLAAGAGHGQLVSSDVTSPPVASNVNYGPGTVDPNVAAAPIGADGKVCFANGPLAQVDLVADHLATIIGSAVTLATAEGAPFRIADTRVGQSGTAVPPSGRICASVNGAPGGAALVNLTPVLAAGPGYGQLVSSEVANPPVASNVNYGPGSVDPNVAAAPIGADGKVCYVNGPLAQVDLVADHLATIADEAISLATPSGAPARRVDTRQTK